MVDFAGGLKPSHTISFFFRYMPDWRSAQKRRIPPYAGVELAEWRNDRHSALQKNRSLPIFKQDVGRNETARRYGFVESVMRAHSDKPFHWILDLTSDI